ncbi:hypothetical protein [Microbacterium maritypicum]
MRIQILPLPPVTLGDATEIPFALILDQLDPDYAGFLMQQTEILEDIRERWGARTVIVNADDGVEINPRLVLPAELEEQLIAHLASVAEETS